MMVEDTGRIDAEIRDTCLMLLATQCGCSDALKKQAEVIIRDILERWRNPLVKANFEKAMLD